MTTTYSDRKYFLDRIYEDINTKRKKYGQLKKCELHIHTPESACYRFHTSNDANLDDIEGKYLYSKMTTIEVLNYSLEVGYLSKDIYDKLIEELEHYNSSQYLQSLKDKNIPYGSLKEYIAYMTIAYKLYIENINVAVISDHNTVSGYRKLNYAINKYFDEHYNKNSRKVIKLFLGVEISCSDRNHLMIIYDEKKINQLERYLEDIILEKGLGTYYDTRKVVEDMKNHNAITYICHVNTSNLFGNAAYKKKLFNSNWLNGIGLTNIEKIDTQKSRIREFRKDISDLAIVYEGDSHAINEMGKKNTWIKLSNMKFKSLKKAFLNHRVSIYVKKPLPVEKYIKGLVIQSGEKGFLGSEQIVHNKKETPLIVNFSQDLNCIIGGRGSGKSTILNIIEIIYSMECDDMELLEYISRHKRIYSIFINKGNEYLIEFVPQVNRKGIYTEYPSIIKNSYYKEDGTYKLKPQWYNIFKIIKNKNNRRQYAPIHQKYIPDLLKQVFRRAYNINKLVDKINNKEISEYIKNVITYNVDYAEINQYIKKIIEAPSTKILKVIRESLSDIMYMIDNRKESFSAVIKEFNETNKKSLSINYEPMYDRTKYFDYFMNIFERDCYNSSPEQVLKQHVCKTYLTWADVQDYFSQFIKQKNYFEILDLLLNKKFADMEKILKIEDFQSIDDSYYAVNRGWIELNKSNRKIVYIEIFNKVKANKDLLRKSIVNCFKLIDNFDLQFNINFKEDVKCNSTNFKRLSELSLGQKVVALLTFVFNFGVITRDSTPLIIDQPEDNLDNVYIYKTLVESLKNIKNSRQVIVITHSSTIVTNADAEEVIVMKSNGRRGWVEKNGYPSDEIITNHILNYLEGGIESFKHKRKMYNVILNN
ncbi:hypothetical protein DVW12_16060 [Clostridium botulinum]|nr:hypothetical protein [Clostridium botulinum]